MTAASQHLHLPDAAEPNPTTLPHFLPGKSVNKALPGGLLGTYGAAVVVAALTPDFAPKVDRSAERLPQPVAAVVEETSQHAVKRFAKEPSESVTSDAVEPFGVEPSEAVGKQPLKDTGHTVKPIRKETAEEFVLPNLEPVVNQASQEAMQQAVHPVANTPQRTTTTANEAAHPDDPAIP